MVIFDLGFISRPASFLWRNSSSSSITVFFLEDGNGSSLKRVRCSWDLLSSSVATAMTFVASKLLEIKVVVKFVYKQITRFKEMENQPIVTLFSFRSLVDCPSFSSSSYSLVSLLS